MGLWQGVDVDGLEIREWGVEVLGLKPDV